MKMINLFSLDKKQIILLVLASLVIVYVDSSLVIKMQNKGIKKNREKVIKLKQDIETLGRDLAAMRELEGKAEDVKKEAVLRAKKIISEEEIPLLLQSISSLANKRKIRIMQISPSKEASAKGGVSVGGEKLKSVVITLDLMCGYHDFGAFINDLDNAEQFMTIQEIRITTNQNDYFQQRINLVLKTYVKK